MRERERDSLRERVGEKSCACHALNWNLVGKLAWQLKPAKLATYSDTLRLPTTLSDRQRGRLGETRRQAKHGETGRHSLHVRVANWLASLTVFYRAYTRCASYLVISYPFFRYLFSAGFFFFCISFFIHRLMIDSLCVCVIGSGTGKRNGILGTLIKVRAMHYCFFFQF